MKLVILGIIAVFSQSIWSEEPTIEARPERPQSPAGKACDTKQRPSFPEIKSGYCALQETKQMLTAERTAIAELRRAIREELAQRRTAATTLRREAQSSLEQARLESIEQIRKLAEEAKTMNQELARAN